MPGTPLYPKDMATEWMNLKKQVKGAFTSANARVAYQKIGAGIVNVFTSLVIQPGAYILAKYENGNDGVYFGRFIYPDTDSDGMMIMRPDGFFRFISFTRESDGYGFTGIFDGDGNIVVSDDAQAGVGLARPWIPLTFADTLELTNPPTNRETSSTSDTVVVSTIVPIQHPRLRMNAYVHIDVGGSTVNYKVKNVTTGETLLSETTSGGYVTDDFDISTDNFGDQAQLDVTIRRATGSGSVGITVLSLVGRQS